MPNNYPTPNLEGVHLAVDGLMLTLAKHGLLQQFPLIAHNFVQIHLALAEADEFKPAQDYWRAKHGQLTKQIISPA